MGVVAESNVGVMVGVKVAVGAGTEETLLVSGVLVGRLVGVGAVIGVGVAVAAPTDAVDAVAVGVAVEMGAVCTVGADVAATA